MIAGELRARLQEVGLEPVAEVPAPPPPMAVGMHHLAGVLVHDPDEVHIDVNSDEALRMREMT